MTTGQEYILSWHLAQAAVVCAQFSARVPTCRMQARTLFLASTVIMLLIICVALNMSQLSRAIALPCDRNGDRT